MRPKAGLAVHILYILSNWQMLMQVKRWVALKLFTHTMYTWESNIAPLLVLVLTLTIFNV
jgi:hypothetical protein